MPRSGSINNRVCRKRLGKLYHRSWATKSTTQCCVFSPETSLPFEIVSVQSVITSRVAPLSYNYGHQRSFFWQQLHSALWLLNAVPNLRIFFHYDDAECLLLRSYSILRMRTKLPGARILVVWFSASKAQVKVCEAQCKAPTPHPAPRPKHTNTHKQISCTPVLYWLLPLCIPQLAFESVRQSPLYSCSSFQDKCDYQ